MKNPTKQKPRRIRQSQRRVAAKDGIRSKTQSGDARPHLDFLKRHRGSLPEKITESDLKTLNLGLSFLFAWLRVAGQQYDDEADGGRAAAFTTTGGMSQFIELFRSGVAEHLNVPILKLLDALAALEENNVLPILKPVKRRGRAVASHAYRSLKGHVAGTVMRLIKLELDPEQARELVAKELIKLGVRPERGKGDITANTVRHWCDEVASDVGRRGAAAIMYDMIFSEDENKRFHARSPADAQAFAFASLLRYVELIFPALRATTEKPS